VAGRSPLLRDRLRRPVLRPLALRRLHPAAFADDVLFQFGTLERFTIFPGLAAQIIELFGMAAGAMLLTIIGQLLWLGAVVYCALGFLRDRPLAFLSVVAVVALPAGYFRYGYGEPILTSRLFAEAVTLLGWVASRVAVRLPRSACSSLRWRSTRSWLSQASAWR
jgi:hypothetical protein